MTSPTPRHLRMRLAALAATCLVGAAHGSQPVGTGIGKVIGPPPRAIPPAPAASTASGPPSSRVQAPRGKQKVPG